MELKPHTVGLIAVGLFFSAAAFAELDNALGEELGASDVIIIRPGNNKPSTTADRRPQP